MSVFENQLTYFYPYINAGTACYGWVWDGKRQRQRGKSNFLPSNASKMTK
jgi:hypothetical protein